MTCPAITLGSLVMDGVTPDADGILWTPTRLDGWWDSAPVRSGTAESQPLGEYVTVARENGRALSLEVTATSESPNSLKLGDDCYLAIESMKAAARAVLLPVLMLVNDPVLAAQAYVRRVGPMKSSIQGNLVSVHFLVPLLAPDPRRYSQDEDSDNITLTNGDATEDGVIVTAGDVSTPCVITMRGQSTNPRISNHNLGPDAGHRPYLRWMGSLANSGDEVVIDTAAGTVLHNGVDSIANLEAGSQMFDLVPGNNTLTWSRTVTTGGSVVTIERRDAFD